MGGSVPLPTQGCYIQYNMLPLRLGLETCRVVASSFSHTVLHRFKPFCNRAVLLLFLRSHDMLLFPVLTYEYATRCTQLCCSIVTYACTCIYEHTLIGNALSSVTVCAQLRSTHVRQNCREICSL